MPTSQRAERQFTPPDYSLRDKESSLRQPDPELAADAAFALRRAAPKLGERTFFGPFPRIGVPPIDWLIRTVVKEVRQRRIAYSLHGAEEAALYARVDQQLGEAGVLNRGGLEAVARGIALATRQSLQPERRQKNIPSARGLLAVLADVDGLKIINDTTGHAAGDQLLLGTAQLLRRTFRGSDHVGREGGDEFAVLGAVDSEEEARRLMEEMTRNGITGHEVVGIIGKLRALADEQRLHLREQYSQRFPVDDASRASGRFPGRLSIGWHYLPPEEVVGRYDKFLSMRAQGQPQEFVPLLIKEADLNMYEMKRSQSGAR